MLSLDLFYRVLVEEAKRLGFKRHILGEVDSWPILFYEPPIIREKNFLIATAFHGDEQGGPLGLLAFLASQPDGTECNFSMLPMVNPTGYIYHTRYNVNGGNPNRGYEESRIKRTANDPISQEGIILKNNLGMFLTSARNGCLSLHEDVDEEDFYLYSTMANNKKNINLCEALKREAMNFGCKMTKKTTILGDKVEDAVIYNVFDGSFEHLLVNNNVPFVITTEVPAKSMTLEARTVLSRRLIERFREECNA